MSKFGKDQLKRNNVLTLVEALLKFIEGKVKIEKQKLDALEKPVTLYSKEDKDLADCVWEPQKPLLLPGDSKNKGITKEALWLLVECSGGTLQLPTPKNPKEVDYKKQKDQVIQDIIDCLRESKILTIQKKENGNEHPTNKGYWKLEIHLKNCNSIEENLRYIRQELEDKFGKATIRKARTKIKSIAQNETPAIKLQKALLNLDYEDQSFLVKQTLKRSTIAAFLVHGEQETRPDLLFNRLIKEVYSEMLIPDPIKILGSKAISRSIDNIFAMLGKTFGITYPSRSAQQQEIAREKIRNNILERWQNEDVVIWLNRAEYFDQKYLQQIIDLFWKPLAESASSIINETENKKHNDLLFFILDSYGNDFELDCSEDDGDNWLAEISIKLKEIKPLTKNQLHYWIKSDLSRTNLIEYRDDLLDKIWNSAKIAFEDEVCQEEIFKAICDSDIFPKRYKITWEEQESSWLTLKS